LAGFGRHDLPESDKPEGNADLQVTAEMMRPAHAPLLSEVFVSPEADAYGTKQRRDAGFGC
jgi:hypothetical protein